MRWLYIAGRKPIDKAAMRLPIICADANLPLELTRYYLPRLELALDLVVDAPHMRVTQLIGLPVGKMSLQAQPAGKRKNAIKETEAANKRQRLVGTARHLVGGRKGLVITYKAIEKEFEGLDGVEVAHYGDIEGIDRWGDVDVLVIIGAAAAMGGRHRTYGGRHHRQASARQGGQAEAPGLRRRPEMLDLSRRDG